jgi:pullulanase/glycogen debranching enzyme
MNASTPRRWGWRPNALPTPYAKSIASTVGWAGYRVGGPNEDLERDYRDNAFVMPKSVVIDPTFDQKRKLQANAN